MARQTGLVRFTGRMGNVRFYKLKGLDGDFASQMPEINSDRFEKDPNYQALRDHANEFKASSVMGKMIRHALSPIIMPCTVGYFHAKLVGKLRKVGLRGDGKRGQRSIRLSQYKPAIRGLEVNAEVGFDDVVKGRGAVGGHFTGMGNGSLTGAGKDLAYNDYGIRAGKGENGAFEIAWRVPGLRIGYGVRGFGNIGGRGRVDGFLVVPKRATHFQFVLGVCTVSDYIFDEESEGLGEGYRAAVPNWNGRRFFAWSDVFSADDILEDGGVLGEMELVVNQGDFGDFAELTDGRKAPVGHIGERGDLRKVGAQEVSDAVEPVAASEGGADSLASAGMDGVSWVVVPGVLFFEDFCGEPELMQDVNVAVIGGVF